ncbi:MAG: DUF5320 domain-containing protein [Bacteroidetes bacterium]|nr:DUF5320 domain-containing protein [Bacteroidota bacterium]
MPGFDQTGPMGQGPMTGRRMGRCTNFDQNPQGQDSAQGENPARELPENFPGRRYGWGMYFGPGRDYGRGRRGRGRGMGRQNRFRGGS